MTEKFDYRAATEKYGTAVFVHDSDKLPGWYGVTYAGSTDAHFKYKPDAGRHAARISFRQNRIPVRDVTTCWPRINEKGQVSRDPEVIREHQE